MKCIIPGSLPPPKKRGDVGSQNTKERSTNAYSKESQAWRPSGDEAGAAVLEARLPKKLNNRFSASQKHVRSSGTPQGVMNHVLGHVGT